MRISEELEKGLLQVEESCSDNLISLLDVAAAFENAYKFINTSFIADERDFDETVDNLVFTKERYDAINGKTIYNVRQANSEDTSISIEISNNSEISFAITGENKTDSESLINQLNAPSSELLQLMKMNADISFFTENKELVFSEKPYLALKMGNFVEGDKAVLVYKEEGKDNEINKRNTGFKYIRVDQIEGYLKNIKIDERKIPTLAYAYLGLDYSEELKREKYYIKESTYPKLTPEKVVQLTDERYFNKVCDSVLSIGLGGSFILGIGGTMIGGLTVLPILPCILVGVGLPIAISTIYYYNRCKQIERANNKEELIGEARISTYSVLKEAANKNINYQEKELIKRRSKKAKTLFGIKVGEKINPTDTIRETKNLIANGDYLKATLFNAQLAQILNAYSESTSATKENELVEELFLITDEISNGNNTTLNELYDMTIATIKRLSPKVNVNDTLKVIDSLDDTIYYIGARNGSFNEKKNTHIKELVRTSLEVMLQAKASGEDLSIEAIAALDSSIRTHINNYLNDFASRITYFDDSNKSATAGSIKMIFQRSLPSEVKIYKAVNLIANNDLTTDLLGKQIKEKAKTKTKVEE